MNDFPLPAAVENSPHQAIQKIRSITYERFSEQVKTFVRQSALRLKAGTWLDDKKPTSHYLSMHVGDEKILQQEQINALFTPFIEKHVFDPGSECAIIADVHGDIEALVIILDELCKQGYLDDDFRIIKDHFYLVFLGDYANRGSYSVEVMMLLFHLQSQNLGKLFLLRGNHEYAACNKNWYDRYVQTGRTGEIEEETLLGEFARKFDLYYYPDLLYWYEYLPVACYLGCRDDQLGITNFIQCCHAGIEMGLPLSPFLAHQEARFQKITHLDRQGALQKILTNYEFAGLAQQIKASLDYFKNNTSSQKLVETYLSTGLFEVANWYDPRVLRLGMQWNNFLTEDNDAVGFTVSIKHRVLFLGSHLTHYFFDQAGSSSTKLISLIRGHQHLNDYDHSIGLASPMLDHLIANKGLYGQWKGKVYTLSDSGATTRYHSFVIMTLQQKPEDWAIKHFFKPVHEQTFTVESRKMVG